MGVIIGAKDAEGATGGACQQTPGELTLQPRPEGCTNWPSQGTGGRNVSGRRNSRCGIFQIRDNSMERISALTEGCRPLGWSESQLLQAVEEFLCELM